MSSMTTITKYDSVTEAAKAGNAEAVRFSDSKDSILSIRYCPRLPGDTFPIEASYSKFSSGTVVTDRWFEGGGYLGKTALPRFYKDLVLKREFRNE